MEATLSDAQRLSDGPASVPPKARLPGEDMGIARDDVREPIANPSKGRVEGSKRRSTKSVLMSTVGVVFLLGAVGAMGYAQRAELERLPIVQHFLPELRQALVSIHAPAFMQASKALVAGVAAAPVAAHTTMSASGVQISARSPSVAAHTASPHTASAQAIHGETPAVASMSANATVSAKAELAQFDAFHATPATASAPHAPAASPAQATPAQAAVASNETAPATTATKAMPQTIADHAASLATASKSASTPTLTQATMAKRGANETTSATTASRNAPPSAATGTAPAQPAPAPAAHAPHLTPVTQAVALRAAPMTPQQQVDVIHLVTKLGVLIRDQKTEIAVLHAQVSNLSSTVNDKLTDFDRRLSLAEANGAIAAAMGAPTSQPPAQNAAVFTAAARDPAPAPHRDRATVKPASQASASDTIQRSVADYHIQAASPGLAMLSVAGGAPLEIAVGDDVPGVGHVKAIVQNGTSWQVQTDHGVIQ